VTITASNPSWVLDEDDALKAKLSGFTVKNPADGTPLDVAVYFRFPDPEERTRTFPHIAIDLVDIQFARERAHRAFQFPLNYNLEENAAPPGFQLVADDFPLPWDLIYQLGVYSRQPRHDRQLLLMMYQMFPEQFGSLDMSTIDGTIRRADLLEVVRRDTVDAAGKRLYRFIVTVSISSEFFLNQIQTVQQATGFKITYVPTVGSLTGAPIAP
jgi:hypothetical protein